MFYNMQQKKRWIYSLTCYQIKQPYNSFYYKRFPPDFMFQLNVDEWSNLKSQIVTSSWGGARKQPFAFTEQGNQKGLPQIETALSLIIFYVLDRQRLQHPK